MNPEEFAFVAEVIGKAQLEDMGHYQHILLAMAIENAEIDYQRHGDSFLKDNNFESVEAASRAYVEACYESIKNGDFE